MAQALLHSNEKAVAQLNHQVAQLRHHANHKVAQLRHHAQEFVDTFNWSGGSFVIITPLIALYGLFVSPFHPYTCILNIILWRIILLGVTAGYHRLWSHRTYEANVFVKLVLLILGWASFNMSVVDWCLDHRAHHKYTDTDKDPYDATKGFWYCHIGWLMKKREMPKSDIRDILADPLLRFQHTYYAPLAFFFGWGVPVLIAGLGWGDWKGGFYVAVIRTVVISHITYSINSWAHWAGNFEFSDQQTARESPILGFLALGEGYHNFHHEFPNDYRNGIHWYAYDSTKWFIAMLEFLGLVWKVNRTPPEVIEKAKIQTALKLLQAKREKHF